MRLKKFCLFFLLVISGNFFVFAHQNNEQDYLNKARKLYNVNGVTDYKSIVDLYDKGCKAGDVECCTAVSKIYEEGGCSDVELDDKIRYSTIESNIENVHGLINKSLEDFIKTDPKSVPKDLDKAKFYLTEACELKDFSSCGKVADYYYNGIDPETERKIIKGAARESCRIQDKFNSKDCKKALKYSKKSCELGNAYDCVRVAFMINNAEGTDRKIDEVIKALKTACEDAHSDEACVFLYDIYANHNEGESEYSKKYWDKNNEIKIDKNVADIYWKKAEEAKKIQDKEVLRYLESLPVGFTFESLFFTKGKVYKGKPYKVGNKYIEPEITINDESVVLSRIFSPRDSDKRGYSYLNEKTIKPDNLKDVIYILSDSSIRFLGLIYTLEDDEL